MQQQLSEVSTDAILRSLVEELVSGDYRAGDGAPLKCKAAYKDAVIFVYLRDLATAQAGPQPGYSA